MKGPVVSQDGKVWRHQCPKLQLGRLGRRGWRALSRGQDCNLCGAKPPKKKLDKNLIRRRTLGLRQLTVEVPKTDAAVKAVRALAKELTTVHVASLGLCQGKYEHVIINGQCARCKEKV